MTSEDIKHQLICPENSCQCKTDPTTGSWRGGGVGFNYNHFVKQSLYCQYRLCWSHTRTRNAFVCFCCRVAFFIILKIMSLLVNVTVTLEGYVIWCTPVSPAHPPVLQTHTQHTHIRGRHNHYTPTTIITAAIIIITTTIIIIISTVASCTACTEGGHNYSVLRHQICRWWNTYPVNGTLSFNAKTNHQYHHPYHCHTIYTLDGTLSFKLSCCR